MGRKSDKMNIACIFAGGSGQRMKTNGKPKQFLELHGKPIIIHTLELFENCVDVDAIIVACIPDWIDYLDKLITKFCITKVKFVVAGGSTGQESIYNAVRKTADNFPEDSIVLIHDGVRPLIDEELISKNIQTVKQFGSCITSTPCYETIVEAHAEKVVLNIPKRDVLYTAQAPQGFFLKDMIKVHEEERKAGRNNAIDSCSLMKSHGYDMHLLEGPRSNIKITTPDDFYIFRALYDLRENDQIFG